MKNLDKEQFHWFGFGEIKDLDNTPVESIRKFTFAPFVPLYLYPLLRKGWDFLVLPLLLNILFPIYLYLSYIRRGDFWVQFTDLMSKTKITPNEIEAMKNYRNLDSAFGSMGRWRFLGSPKSVALINITLYFVVFLIIMVFAGLYSRQLSWNRNKWRSFDEFNKSENKWNTIGFIFMVLCVMTFIIDLFCMIMTK